MSDWRQECEDSITERNNLIAEVQQLRAVNELLYAALKEVEWVDDSDEGGCPACFAYKRGEHLAGCQLKLALDAARPWAAKTEIGT